MRYTDPIVKTDVGYFFCMEGLEYGPFVNRNEADEMYKRAKEYYERLSNTQDGVRDTANS
jgi:hypothetical protein